MSEEKPWRDEQQLRELYVDERLSTREIGDKLQCSRKTVETWIDNHALKPETKPWRDEGQLRKLRDEGLSEEKIAERLDCSREAVEDWIHRHNIETRPRTPETPELLKNCQKLEQLYHDRGMSTYAIAEQLDCAPSAVYNWLRRHDIETRSVGSQPGELHHRWKGGDEPYYGPNWTEQRKKAHERDGNQCSKCGITSEEHEKSTGIGLDVHHQTPIRTFDDPEDANTLDNLVTLCRACHNQIEPPQSITHE